MASLTTWTAMALTAAASPASASELFVDASAACASGNGTVSLPYCTIGEALASASDGDTILIAPGAYLECLAISKDLVLIGDGAVHLDGGGVGATVSIEPNHSVTLRGLTVTGGAASGIQCEGALTMMDCVVSNNFTAAYGGGLGVDRGEAYVVRCAFSGNVAADGGGAVDVFAGRLVIEDSTIFGNASWGSPARGGGSLSALSGDLRVTNCTISGNVGGGLDLQWTDSVSIDHSTIVDNIDGAGIYNDQLSSSGVPQLRNTIVAGNIALGTPLAGDIIEPIDLVEHNFLGAVNWGANQPPHGANGNSVGTIAMPLDPMLGPLQPSAGSLPVHLPMVGSPVVDSGSPLQFRALDQVGEVRVAGAIDIGAVEGAPGGTARCVTSPNSTGRPARIEASGSLNVVHDDVTLTVRGLPPQQGAMFLVSSSVGFVGAPGGSLGNLCLAGAIGRFDGPGQVQSTGPLGELAFDVPLMNLPVGQGGTAAQSGETWYFQLWFRDLDGALAVTNFSDAVGVLLF